MIWELFILGGVAFWILTGLVFLLLLWAASDDRAVASGLLLAGWVAAIYLFGNASTLSMPDAWVFYIGIPAYLVTGTLWGIGKWYLFVSREVMRYRERRQEFLILNGIEHATMDTPVPPALKASWRRATYGRQSRPIARQHKRRIISWMCFWPTSVVWAVIDEPWRRIYTAVASLLQRIADSVYEKAGVDADLVKPVNLKEAMEEKLASCRVGEDEWDAEIVAEAINLAAREMGFRGVTAQPDQDGSKVSVLMRDERAGPDPRLPASVMGIEIEIVGIGDFEFPGLDEGTPLPPPRRGGKPAK